jgi:integrase
VHTLRSVSRKADGDLWKGTKTEMSAWAHIRVVGERIGHDTALDDITTLKVDDLKRQLRRLGKSDATINRHLSSLRKLLNWSHDRGFRTVPVAAIKFDLIKERPGRIRWITFEEEAQLKQYLPQNCWDLVRIAIATGCRRDELLTAQARDIVPAKHGRTGEPIYRLHIWENKTDEPRTIPLSVEIGELLLALVNDKRMPTKMELRYRWRIARRKMGLEKDPDFVFHATRHTKATRMLDRGDHLLVIKAQLGHKRVETTERYTHVTNRNLEDALV